MREKRSQRRLGLGISIQVMLPDSDRPITVEDQEISWGGAQFITSDPGVRDGGRLGLILPWVGGQSFSIEAEVVRRERLDDGRHRVAVRFSSLSQRSEFRLEKLLDLLAEREERQTACHSTPTMERLELIFDDEAEMREKLAQIADGHLFVTVFGAYEIDQSILLVIGGTKDFPGFHLRARVNAQAVERAPRNGWIHLVRLDLKFEHPREELRHLADMLSHA
ncbi:PilZ domain-containing protein [Thiocystis violacea]|uniref:PilZ domain-containing protein n=1 Tax=Thiocystis violacea TaxID=13725 RepID=UPI00190635F5|nr:PilZ domain-containing protein [Thiocystis violacea]MBK1718282.1 hypothetical protein [Thiocystis violacea]